MISIITTMTTRTTTMNKYIKKVKVLSLMTILTLLTQVTFAANIDTDRTWYLSGESMNLSVTTDDALIAYAELCDTHSLVASSIIRLHDGKGTGTMELPSDLHSGYYVLSVYTRDNANVSRRLVAVVNPLQKNVDDDIEWVQIADADSLSYPCTREGEYISSANFIDEKEMDIRETEGHIVKAHIRNVYNGSTFAAKQIVSSLSIVGKQIHYFEGKMVNDSTAVFFAHGVHGKQPLILSAASNTGVSLPIEMISPFAALIPKSLPLLVFHYRRSEVEQRSRDMQLHQFSITPAKRELQIGEKDDADMEDGVPMDYDPVIFGKKPNLTYDLNEYRQFLTIREVLIEYVSRVKREKIKGVNQLVLHGEDIGYESWPAMVFIDGMPVIDIDRLLNYDARRIRYINIYEHQYTFGNGVYKGILSFVSRSGRLTNYPTEPNTQYVVYEFPE